MDNNSELIRNLRETVRLSPDNVLLRHQLANMLMARGLTQEAEREYREALRLAPSNQQVRLALAKACHQLGKHPEALVIVEDLVQNYDPPAEAYALYARLLLASGERKRAVEQYRKAVQADPSAADSGLAKQLKLQRTGVKSDAGRGRVRLPAGEPSDATELNIERPSVSFKDVGGIEDVKEQIRLKIIHPLAHPEICRAYGKPIGGGILMYGPPGCGKTHLARATAGEVEARFIAVGINDVVEWWLGKSERNLHELFELARRSKPCVMFFDEVDALGASRSDMRHSAGRQIINQFLAELDGVKTSNVGVLVLAATNAPWHLDSAFRRPGRFDRILFVPPPDATARASILRILLEGKPVGDIDYDRIVANTEKFSGADLKAVFDVAVEGKMREAMAAQASLPLTTADLLAAVRKVRPSTTEWFDMARNYALYANQAGIYDEIVNYLELR